MSIWFASPKSAMESLSRGEVKKVPMKPMPKAMARANAQKSSIRARVEHVFAHQKNRFGLFIRTIGLARAEAKLTLANLAYNFDLRIPRSSRAPFRFDHARYSELIARSVPRITRAAFRFDRAQFEMGSA